MAPKHEYKFVRRGESVLEVRPGGKNGCRDAIVEHAAEDWRAGQIFAPGTAAYGTAGYFELILEREV